MAPDDRLREVIQFLSHHATCRRGANLPLPGRRLALDRIDVDGPQPAQAQHFHLDRAVDPVAIEHSDQVVNALDLDAVELDHDVTGQ